MTVEITVVGGGIIGLAVANEALRRGHRTGLVRVEHAGQASRAAGGMLAPIAEAEPTLSPLVSLGLASLEIYEGWVRDLESTSGLSCDLRPQGSLLVALHADHVRGLMHQQEGRRSLGLTAEWIERRELLDREPHLTSRVQGALWIPRERAVDPRRLHEALEAAFSLRGGEHLEAPAGIRIDCTGAWTQRIPLRPVRGQALRLSGPSLVQHVVRTPDVYLVPRSGGRLYVGATSDDVGFDANATAGGVFDLLREAHRVLPGAYELNFDEVVVGFRPAARDHLPAIGRIDDDFFVCTGHYRNGVLLAPISARLLMDVVEGGSPEDLAAFEPRRFGARSDETGSQ